MGGEKSDVQHPPSLARVTIHKPSSVRRGAALAIFVALYAVAGQWCYDTAGEPLAAAVKEVAAREALANASGGNITANTTQDLLAELAEINAEPHHSLAGNETMHSPKPLPSWFLPNAWAGATMFATCTMNCLFFLLGYWFVWFKAGSLYSPVTEVTDGVVAHVRTQAHKGADAICAMKRSAQAPYRMCFEFQRQRYEFVSQADSEAEADDVEEIIGLGKGNGYVRLTKCPVDLPVGKYHKGQGLVEEDITSGNDRFGKNTLTVPTPKFWELYKQQMISPLVVFQFFTAILWMLDEHWQFVIFQMVMILVLESTTVFQRIKTFGTLNSMSSKPYRIKVFRNKEWADLSSLLLLPGDIISVKNAVTKTSTTVAVKDPKNMTEAEKTAAKEEQKEKQAAAIAAQKEGLEENTGVVPCDCVLLVGDAVLNEATLTGESVPQMKDALPQVAGQENTALDIEGSHRVHVMFSGTQIIACNSSMQNIDLSKVPTTDPRRAPDGGCVCYVLRTGFNSSQGKMVQMIECSQNKMTDDSKETAYALLVLLFFALIAAGYVLKKGLEKGDRTTHELLIKCVIIITSTVPKQLPMQMAMAVNTALIGLMKKGVFCTEPFRVPLAGKVNACLFDKTGTLTTDQLVPIGMINSSGRRSEVTNGEGSAARTVAVKVGEYVTVDGVGSKPELNGEKVKVLSLKPDNRVEVACPDGEKISLKRSVLISHSKGAGDHGPPHGLFPMTDASPEALMVVAGCHALVEIAGAGLMGDPIELAALKGMDWRYESKINTAWPGNWETTEKAIENLQASMQKLEPGDVEKKALAEKQLVDAKERVAAAKAKAKQSPLKSVKITHRHHFSSKLQRMSVVAHVDREASPKGTVCLVKGSPEAIMTLLAKGKVPEWYERTYREMAEQGLRILALAYKWCDGNEPQLKGKETPPREWVESDLTFGGFLAFGCKTRADSAIVLRSLKDADIALAMATGDAPLTALHVAKEVDICAKNPTHPCLLLEISADTKTVQWVRAIGMEPCPQAFESPGVVELSKKHDLMCTELALEAAAEASDGHLWKEVHAIKVFARMSPQGKANVIRAMQEHNGNCVFMCGDGGNDVGALKQADIGMALLSGYGNTNAGEEGASDEAGKNGKTAEEELNKRQLDLAKKGAAAQAAMKAEMKAVQAELQAKQKEKMMAEVNARIDRGEGGVMTTVNVMRETMGEFKQELQVRQREIAQKHGSVYDQKKDANLLKEEMESELGGAMVRPGDASVAAPFTSRSPSVANMVDVVRQGRCTLLSALQNQQIMMLECIITAYTLSALSLEGARSSDRQMMATGWLLSIASMAFAFATTIDKMSKHRPLNSLFHPAVFFSMLGQAAIHLGCMVTAVRMATDEMGPLGLKEVADFHKTQKMIRLGQLCKDSSVPGIKMNSTDTGCPVDITDENDWMAMAMAMFNTPFLPNLLNTVVWLVETSQMCAVTFVNYKGRPWMRGIMENHALFLSSFMCIALVAVGAWELIPEGNRLLHLAPFPNEQFRWQVMGLVAMSLAGTFIWDRVCIALFAPDIWDAMIENAKETSMEDIMSLLRTVGKVGGCMAVYLTGNPLIWMGAFWFYKKTKREAAEAEAKAEAEHADLN